MPISGSAIAYMQHSLNVEQGNISPEKIQRNPRHLCACATLGAWPVWEDIVTFWDGWWERVTHLSLLLGDSNYMLHVAEKFWKQQLSGPTSCWRKDWMEWMQFYILGKYHRWEWELHITTAGGQQLSATCSWKVVKATIICYRCVAETTLV